MAQEAEGERLLLSVAEPDFGRTHAAIGDGGLAVDRRFRMLTAEFHRRCHKRPNGIVIGLNHNADITKIRVYLIELTKDVRNKLANFKDHRLVFEVKSKDRH
jgi:hypothetical protein